MQYVLHKVQKKILQVHKTILQVQNTEICAWIGRLHTTQQQVALLSQFKATRTIFFSPQNLYLMPANRVWILWKAKKATNWP